MDAAMLHELFEYRDGVLFWKKNIRRAKAGKPTGCINTNGYIRTIVCGKLQLNHRIIYLMHHGTLPKHIDHIDGNRANNKIENLREATPSQNQHNKKLSISNTSGVKGVCWHKTAKTWTAQIRVDKKLKNLGYYDSIEEAKQVVEKARILYHGSYANNG